MSCQVAMPQMVNVVLGFVVVPFFTVKRIRLELQLVLFDFITGLSGVLGYGVSSKQNLR